MPSSFKPSSVSASFGSPPPNAHHSMNWLARGLTTLETPRHRPKPTLNDGGGGGGLGALMAAIKAIGSPKRSKPRLQREPRLIKQLHVWNPTRVEFHPKPLALFSTLPKKRHAPPPLPPTAKSVATLEDDKYDDDDERSVKRRRQTDQTSDHPIISTNTTTTTLTNSASQSTTVATIPTTPATLATVAVRRGRGRPRLQPLISDGSNTEEHLWLQKSARKSLPGRVEFSKNNELWIRDLWVSFLSVEGFHQKLPFMAFKVPLQTAMPLTFVAALHQSLQQPFQHAVLRPSATSSSASSANAGGNLVAVELIVLIAQFVGDNQESHVDDMQPTVDTDDEDDDDDDLDVANDANDGHSVSSLEAAPDSNRKKRSTIAEWQRQIFMKWLCTGTNMRNPYPSERRTKLLATATKLSPASVSGWFINARERLVKPWWYYHRQVLLPNSSSFSTPSRTSSPLNGDGSSDGTSDGSSHMLHLSMHPAPRLAVPPSSCQLCLGSLSIVQSVSLVCGHSFHLVCLERQSSCGGNSNLICPCCVPLTKFSLKK